jgi:hypothetical protein
MKANRMQRILFPILAVVGSLLPGVVSGNDFEIGVTVTAGDSKVRTERTEETTLRPTEVSRPTIAIAAQKTAGVSWHVENTGKADEFKDVLVHFFVVREDKPGQPEVPKLTENVTYEGALTMDFKPHEHADWQFDLKIDEPGSYLLRVETIGMLASHGHDHYAAMDLIVK